MLALSSGHRRTIGQDKVERDNIVHSEPVLVGLEGVTCTGPELIGSTGSPMVFRGR